MTHPDGGSGTGPEGDAGTGPPKLVRLIGRALLAVARLLDRFGP